MFHHPLMDESSQVNFLIYCNPKFEKWEYTKSGLVPMSRQEKLMDLFLVFPTRLET